jgi:hypothetical protein
MNEWKGWRTDETEILDDSEGIMGDEGMVLD